MKRLWTFVCALILLLGFCLIQSETDTRAQTSTPPYKNPALPIDQRVNDLISRMTLEEKVSQMMNSAVAIDRLGIPAYDWWNECLHGVARAGYATVFPQAIGLAATWDDELLHQVADVTSTEARAKHHEFARNGDRARYKGLTFWSPNINIFRDPRWGRGQETYGEDPYLTSRLGVAFVKGLQGDDPRYLKVVATPKHYAVHSGPEPERHSFDATASERDLRETYLPAFRATIVEARAASVMCAYNRTNGQPCCSNTRLLQDILRKEWGFDGYTVSDCGAIDDIYKGHKTVDTVERASAIAVKAGTDLSCGGEYQSLIKGVKAGLISEVEIDASLRHLFTARFRLGMFDPPEMVPYARIPFSENDSAAHRALARKTAQESIVLLKNQNSTLPLKKTLKTIAVIGPNADASEVLLGNYSGQPSSSVTPLAGIRQKVGSSTQVLYSLGANFVGEDVAPVPAGAVTQNGKGSQSGFKGEYFNNKDLSGRPALTRNDEQVNFDWARGRPAPGVNEDGFSVRWTGKFSPPESGPYKIGISVDDGARLFFDGKLLIDSWTNNQSSQARTILKEVNLEAGRYYDLKIEYYDDIRGAIAKFVWSFPRFNERLIEEAVGNARKADAVVMVLGITPELEGEEMNVKIEGFRGGDRTDISLPKAQEELMKAVAKVGKPTVLVLLNGSALAVNWADHGIPAIVEAWYPGEEGGSALADVLFGDYNPAGRLPVTFYKSVDQLPPFENYSMAGRTYRYFTGDALYPFGFGLSYTRFEYSRLQLASQLKAGEEIEVSAEIRNVGRVEGDEVAQLYVKHLSASVPVPIRALQGFKRIHLRPGETKTVTFKLSPRQLSVIDDQGRRVMVPGDIGIEIGGGQAGQRSGSSNVLAGRLNVTGETFVVK